jgi:hypothetical protein
MVDPPIVRRSSSLSCQLTGATPVRDRIALRASVGTALDEER